MLISVLRELHKFIWLVRAVQGRVRRFCDQTGWALMADFRDAKSADFLYEVGNVFVPWQHRLCGIN